MAESLQTMEPERLQQIVRYANSAVIDRLLAKKSLHEFIKQGWRTVEPGDYVDGWHIGIICDHLEAVHRGEIKRLMINMPPRHMKSLAVSVFFPAWSWLQNPGHRFLTASYAHTLSIRDSVKCRRLVQSTFYKNLLAYYHPEFSLAGDVNNKIRFENNFGGVRIASSVEGALTGEGGDTIIVDDPHNVIEGESATKRQSVLDWWDQSMSTRLNNPKKGSYIIIMQRVHEDDLCGHILASGSKEKWCHLKLPARYEGKKIVSTIAKTEDIRTEMDQPLWPEQYGDEELHQLEMALGSYGSAGQLQQRPAPREGGMFKVKRLLGNIVNEVPYGLINRSIRYWDKAGTINAGCMTAGVLMHELKDRTILIADVVAGQWGALEREERIKQTAIMDGRKVKIWTEQEPGSGGKESAEATIRNLSGYVCKADRVTGDKVTRAEPFAAQVEAGNVFILNREWTKEYIDELELFPNGKFKDRVDASSGAFNKLFFKRISPHAGTGSTGDWAKQDMAGQAAPTNKQFPDDILAILEQAKTPEERAELEMMVKSQMALVEAKMEV